MNNLFNGTRLRQKSILRRESILIKLLSQELWVSSTVALSLLSVTSMFLASYYENRLIAVVFYISLLGLFFDETAAIVVGFVATAITNLYTLPLSFFGISEAYKIIIIILVVRYWAKMISVPSCRFRILLPVLIIVAVNLISSLGAVDRSAGIYFFFYMCMNLAAFFVISESQTDFLKLSFVLKTIVPWILTLFFLVSIANGTLIDTLTTFTIKAGINKNGFAAGIGLYGMVSLTSLFTCKNGWSMGACWGYGLSWLFIIWSGSRASLLMLGCTSVLYVVYCYTRQLHIKQRGKFILLVACLVLAMLLIIVFVPSLRSRLDIRLLISSGGESRALAWYNFIFHVVPRHLLIGVGLSGINEIAALQALGYGLPSIESHNIFIAILVQTGFLGLIVYMFFFCFVFYRQYSRLKFHSGLIMPLLLFVGLLVNGLGEVVFIEPFFWYTLGYGIGYTYFVANNISLLPQKSDAYRPLISIRL
ncbi:O-antigen ligase family protein [Oscillospiraceae bacterium PP1C4]